jgi:hypothetical protein
MPSSGTRVKEAAPYGVYPLEPTPLLLKFISCSANYFLSLPGLPKIALPQDEQLRNVYASAEGHSGATGRTAMENGSRTLFFLKFELAGVATSLNSAYSA